MSRLLAKGSPYLLSVCAIAIALILTLMPSEKSIGPVIKIVYLHGALSRVGMAGLLMAGLCGALSWILRSACAGKWSWALALTGWLFWVGHFVVSMPATRLTWGTWIAWGEPRVTMTLQLAALGLVVLLISRLLGSQRFMTAANIALAGAALFIAANTGSLLHPLDPIGASPSELLKAFYLVLLAVLFVALLVIAHRIASSKHVSWLDSPPASRVGGEVR